MSHWSVAAGALALMSLPLMHWFALGRGLAVSGRISAMIDRFRNGAPAPSEVDRASQAELLAALRAMTAAEFGDTALEDTSPPEATPSRAARRAPETTGAHALFLIGLSLGGALSVAFGSGFALTTGLHSALFPQIFGDGPLVRALVLFGSGVLVGVGTRMAGGCTSGHGLCGVSQLQPGSLVATASFFGAGVIVSFGLGALL